MAVENDSALDGIPLLDAVFSDNVLTFQEKVQEGRATQTPTSYLSSQLIQHSPKKRNLALDIQNPLSPILPRPYTQFSRSKHRVKTSAPDSMARRYTGNRIVLRLHIPFPAPVPQYLLQRLPQSRRQQRLLGYPDAHHSPDIYRRPHGLHILGAVWNLPITETDSTCAESGMGQVRRNDVLVDIPSLAQTLYAGSHGPILCASSYVDGSIQPYVGTAQ